MQDKTTASATSMQLLLVQLSELNIKLKIEGDQLQVNAPAGVLNAALRDALKEHREALKQHLARSAATPVASWPRIAADLGKRNEPFPLSDVQHAYWVGRSRGLNLGGVATHYYYELDCEQLDFARFTAAFQRLINRHDMLRAVVHDDGRQQILNDLPPFVMPMDDMRCASVADREARMQALRDELSHQQLPANRWPLFDIRAVRTSDSHTRLYFSWDFINLDAWSLYGICREWNTLYDDIDAPLQDIGLSYRDYVLAERSMRSSEMFARDHDYWWNRLDNIPAAPQLPVLTGAASENPQFTRRRFRMDMPQWDSLKRRAQSMGITPSALLLAAYAEVLAFWSKEPRFSLNMTLFSRLPLHEDVNKLVGDFTCLTLLEVDAAHLPSFSQRAMAIQQQFLRDFEHRLVSGVDVLREWSKRKGYGLHAAMPVVFTSCLVLNSAQGDDAGLVESFGKMVHGISQTPQVWLDNQVMEDSQGLVLNWDALEEVFLPGVLQSMFDSYCGLIRSLASSSEAWDAGHPLQLPQDQGLQRAQVNDTQAELSDKLMHQLFVERALAQPQAVAIATKTRSITYAELLSRAVELAGLLLERGVKPAEVVAVVMPRGWQQVAAVLGIMIAGGAYLPVDAELPQARRDQLFEQSAAAIAVTSSELEGLELPPSVQVVTLPEHAGWSPVTAAPPLRQAQDSLAYVIFTSGSTGVPKGVMIDHRGAVNTIEHINRLFGITSADKTLMVSALNFDLSTYDIFGLLAAGGCIVIPDDARSVDPEHWMDLIATHGVTVWNSAPALMSMLVTHMEGFDEPPARGIRLAMLSGDWIPLSLKARLDVCLPHAKLVSLGGATEASIWSIFHPFEGVDPAWKSIPYGKPLPNQTMHVLNDRMQPCPVNVTGRIFIGGIGLAQGYLNDAQKTAAKFIRLEDGTRLYDTGDLGRYMPDGNIEFLGREDSQIKLRGHRIELGEISAALRSKPGVRESLAVVDGDGRSEQQSLWVYLLLDREHQHEILLPVAEDVDTDGFSPQAIGRIVSDEEKLLPLAVLDEPTRELWAQLDGLYLEAVVNAFLHTPLAEPGREVSVQDMMESLNAAPRYERWMRRALRHLVAHGLLHESGDRYHAPQELPRRDLMEVSRDVEARLNSVLGLTEREARWFTVSAEHLRALLSEDLHSAELYTSEETAIIYQKLFPDSHVQLRRSLNALLALRPGHPMRVMEVGSGLGSATQHVLPALAGHCAHYDFTDISQYFLKRAADKFSAYDFVHYGLHDLDRAPELQGFKPHSYDLVIASSVLHDVGDIPGTLRNLRRLLSPGGTLMLLEETKFFPSFDLTMGLQQGFDVFRDGRQNHPLLERVLWREQLQEAGFDGIEVLNVEGSVSDFVGFDVILAQTVEPAYALDDEALDRHLLQRLPAYMKPTGYQVLAEFPTTANGKIDYRALSRPIRGRGGSGSIKKPANALEQQLLDIWCETLGQDAISTTSSFFEIGGDSLLLVEVRNLIKQRLGLHVATTVLFEHPSITALAQFLSSQDPQQGGLTDASSRAQRQRQALRQQRGANQGAREHV
ncbi:non-ribosomal peptide synthetase [Piscinibacter terrae]|uniref:Amino acid adenylation domain-containing protein n=1 Tax=Piscinibacter terrae TaxID=2496871 RepID=A0A3N7HM17_9BURK|nr:non-ribosomal peptide synthetase [Albitalea terrae]RQP22643.1 amino acid adenylation domain-containing protein [Albitalea terrae]